MKRGCSASESLPAELYAGQERVEDAAAQQRMVLDRSHRLELTEKARGFFEETE